MHRWLTMIGIAITISSIALPAGCSSRQNPALPPQVSLTICAAASLADALKEVDNLYTVINPTITITMNFASSGTLQTQIENGAPADIFIPASPVQMDNLQKKELLLNDSRINLLGNKVVVVVPVDSTLGINSFSDLASDKINKIAIGDPKSVPAGTYANQAFEQLGINTKIRPKEVLAGDVRQVLTYVEGDNVDAGIVYLTDALTSSKVKIAASAPADINAKIVYPAAVIKSSKNHDAARQYLAFLYSAPAKAVFEKYGFNIIAK